MVRLFKFSQGRVIFSCTEGRAQEAGGTPRIRCKGGRGRTSYLLQRRQGAHPVFAAKEAGGTPRISCKGGRGHTPYLLQRRQGTHPVFAAKEAGGTPRICCKGGRGHTPYSLHKGGRGRTTYSLQRGQGTHPYSLVTSQFISVKHAQHDAIMWILNCSARSGPYIESYSRLME